MSEAATSVTVEVVSRQRGRKINLRQWTTFANDALSEIRRAESRTKKTDDAGATVAFVSDRAIRSLNCKFRGRDAVTDVLSFPGSEDEYTPASEPRSLGDIAISVPQAERQAEENGLTFDEEIAQLILHGLLHLCSYDHATDSGEMNRFEIRLRRRLGIG